MIKKQLIENEKRFTGLEQRLTKKEKSITGLEQCLTKKEKSITGLEQRLTKKEKSITGLEQCLTKKEKSITGLEQRLTKKEKSITGLEQRLTEKEKSIIGLEQCLTKKEKSITGLEQCLTKKEKSITGLEQRLTKKEKSITGLEQRLTEKEKSIIGLEQCLTKKEKSITGLEQCLTKKEKSIIGLEQCLTERDNHLSEKDEEIGCRGERIKALEGQVKSRAEIAAGLKEASARKDEQIAARDQRIEALLNSFSWKTTAPLRWFSGLALHNRVVRGKEKGGNNINGWQQTIPKGAVAIPKGAVAIPKGAVAIPKGADAIPKGADATYCALRQEVLDSGLWDEKWYLSRYYEYYTAGKKRRARNEPFFPLDYYLQEGWKLGHEPSNLLPIQVAQKKVGCSKIEYFLNRLRFDGYQFDENIWVPSGEKIREYVRIRQQRTSKKVVYTCIVQNYDEIMQPYFISADWDYVCFTDSPDLIGQGTLGVWEIRPISGVRSCSVRTNRWYKMHPHVLFPSHEESIYVDGNINIISDYIFDQIAQRDTHILLPQHFVRNCIYQEIEVLLHRRITSKEDKALLTSQRRFLEQEVSREKLALVKTTLFTDAIMTIKLSS